MRSEKIQQWLKVRYCTGLFLLYGQGCRGWIAAGVGQAAGNKIPYHEAGKSAAKACRGGGNVEWQAVARKQVLGGGSEEAGIGRWKVVAKREAIGRGSFWRW